MSWPGRICFCFHFRLRHYSGFGSIQRKARSSKSQSSNIEERKDKFQSRPPKTEDSQNLNIKGSMYTYTYVHMHVHVHVHLHLHLHLHVHIQCTPCFSLFPLGPSWAIRLRKCTIFLLWVVGRQPSTFRPSTS